MLNIFFIQKLFTILLTEITTLFIGAKLVKKSNNQNIRILRSSKRIPILWKKQLKKYGITVWNL